jgi:hypothetical protein
MNANQGGNVARYKVNMWGRGAIGYGAPGASMEVKAATMQDARKLAARAFGLRPHLWALNNAPIYLEASRVEDYSPSDVATYRIHVGYTKAGRNRWRSFATLAEAKAYAHAYFKRSGVILSITPHNKD